MNNWEYKLNEFTGSNDAFRALILREKNQAWEVGALLPSQSKPVGEPAAQAHDGAPISTICIIFKRPLPTPSPSTTFFQ